MKKSLAKFNAVKIETYQDEGKLNYDTCKKRILNLLDDNMRNFKKDSWNKQNRMNKLIVDTDSQSIFTLRLGGKRIARYALSLLDTNEKLNFLSDIYTEVVNGEFDEEITEFLGEEVKKAEARKKVNSAKRREKKRQQREAAAAEKKAAEIRTYKAAKGMVDDVVHEVLMEQVTSETPRYMQV